MSYENYQFIGSILTILLWIGIGFYLFVWLANIILRRLNRRK